MKPLERQIDMIWVNSKGKETVLDPDTELAWIAAFSRAIPVKVEAIPVKIEAIPVKDEAIPVKDEAIPVKLEAISVNPQAEMASVNPFL